MKDNWVVFLNNENPEENDVGFVLREGEKREGVDRATVRWLIAKADYEDNLAATPLMIGETRRCKTKAEAVSLYVQHTPLQDQKIPGQWVVFLHPKPELNDVGFVLREGVDRATVRWLIANAEYQDNLAATPLMIGETRRCKTKSEAVALYMQHTPLRHLADAARCQGAGRGRSGVEACE